MKCIYFSLIVIIIWLSLAVHIYSIWIYIFEYILLMTHLKLLWAIYCHRGWFYILELV